MTPATSVTARRMRRHWRLEPDCVDGAHLLVLRAGVAVLAAGGRHLLQWRASAAQEDCDQQGEHQDGKEHGQYLR